MPKARTAKGYVLEPLPDLRRGPASTTSSALHPIRFVGWLAPWPSFKSDVAKTFRNHNWGSNQIDYLREQGPNLSLDEHVQVGDEPGVQGRFSDRVEQPLSMVAKCEGMGFYFGDSKSFSEGYTKIPDFLIIKSPGTSTAVVGELKVPWVEDHELGEKIWSAEQGSEHDLRKCLGQIAQYMWNRRLKYGILTNYNETIFLRQVVSRGQLGLEYSPAIISDDTYHAKRGSVTLRQAILHVALLGCVDNSFSIAGVTNAKWIVIERR